MPDTDTSRESPPDRQTDQQSGIPRRSLVSWRSIAVTLLLLTIVLMAVLPPLLNVNRFKRRIVTSIGASIGRPVHLDSVSLILLPLPAFKLENFVVSEDPAFGAEPVIHANSVVATLRFSSLWRRKVEFSRISLQEPSINLVHTPQGTWNVESILLQAARIPAAPTGQAKAGADPRFPYIEATGARVNLKSGTEKLPFSLTEADFALWLPEPQQWRIRVVAKPTRTDTDAFDTGSISLEGSLGRAARFDLIPLDLSGEWKSAPLGEASRVLTGRDVGLRGDLRLNITANGTIGSSLVKAVLDLRDARRSDFVPARPLDLQAECQAASAETFHAFHEIRCTWPPLAATGELPDAHRLGSASFEVGTPSLPAATLLDWLRIASDRVPEDVRATGTLDGKVDSGPVAVNATVRSLTARIALKEFTLAGSAVGKQPIKFGDITLISGPPPESSAPLSRRAIASAAANPRRAGTPHGRVRPRSHNPLTRRQRPRADRRPIRQIRLHTSPLWSGPSVPPFGARNRAPPVRRRSQRHAAAGVRGFRFSPGTSHPPRPDLNPAVVWPPDLVQDRPSAILQTRPTPPLNQRIEAASCVEFNTR